jgi:hypothetical protein
MTVPIPPTAGPEDPSIRLAEVETSTIMEIQAPLDATIPAEFDNAAKEAHAWQQQGSTMMDSPAGYGSSGYTVYQPDLDNDSDWPISMNFPHQGP